MRITTDPTDPDDPSSVGDFMESNEHDNVSYTWIKLTDTDTDPDDPKVEFKEWGYGTGPWDPNKRVLSDIRRGACDQLCELFLPQDEN